ncbi:Aryl hydrocarbon receptor [Hypsibius exemplaris]|uniref:Aryl hydrocarbon receptor n=1 Tax=Hypsibius exemplaris TaxID=2072580 RepID=A0A1W0WTD3_HYPEX|nr:Aryl hydrocarbon receptor [Hypsibius exemplaris]
MYATKRRRRSLKGSSSKICLSKSAYDTSHHGNSGGGCGGGNSSSLKSNPSKRHRERLNSELERIASLLPFEANILSKLDKLSILRLSVSYLRIKSYFHAIQLREQTYGGYDGPGGHKTSADHFHADPSLTRTDSVLKALNGFVLVLTVQGEVFFASSNIEEFLGFHQSDVIHQSVYELIHSEDRVELQKQLSWLGSPSAAAAHHPGSRMNPHDAFSSDNFQHLERSLTARFRCLLDNTSGFLRLEIRGRIGVLHGQNFHSAGEAPPGLLAICTPFGPATLPDNLPKESVFKSKLKLDLTIINIDTKGKDLLGWGGEESGCRSFYNALHPDDVLYAASAHRELSKTNSCVMYAHRMARKVVPGTALQWQWVQTTMKIIPKNGKPDHVSAAHRPLSDEEGKDLMTKRASITKLCDLDSDASLALANSAVSERSAGHGVEDSLSCTVTPTKAPKPPKKRPSPAANHRDPTSSSSSTSNNINNTSHYSAQPSSLSSGSSSTRRRKSFSTENVITARNGHGEIAAYSSPYHTESSLNYCAQNTYPTAIFLPTAVEQCSLIPYSGQYHHGTSAGFYSTGALPVSDSVLSVASHGVNGSTLLDRSYDLYAAAAYGSAADGLPSQGDYLKNYYKGMDTYPSNVYNTDHSSSHHHSSATKAAAAANGWMASSHHRQSVLVWNNGNSRPDMSLGFTPSTRTTSGVYSQGAPPVSAFSTTADSSSRHANNQVMSAQRSHDAENNKVTNGDDSSGASGIGLIKTAAPLHQSHNFSICEATNTMLESAG